MPLRLHQAVHGIIHALREIPESQRRYAMMCVFRGIGQDGKFCGWSDDMQRSMCRHDCPCPERPTCDECEFRHM